MTPTTSSLRKRFELTDRWLALLMLAPAAVLVAAFAVFPVVQGFYASFFRIDAATLAMRFTGLENYRQVLGSDLFWDSLWRNLIWVFTGMIAQLVLGLGISLLLHQELKGRNLARGLVLFPYLVPAIVIALTWRFVLDPTLGVFNRILLDMGLIDRPFAILANPRTALIFVIIAGIWKYTPFMVIMFLARLQVIPVEQEEAARLDGANGWQIFRHITLPWLMPVAIIALLLRTIWSFNEFEMVYLFAGGGPLFGTTTLPVLVRHFIVVTRQLGAAAATATLMVVILLTMAWGYFTLYNRAEEELA
ncbi:MAG: sugar ABC transporter permease [Caldilineae bacterium]|nr:MAG: sugar ABC transporter permease [Caldilineae bacterium]